VKYEGRKWVTLIGSTVLAAAVTVYASLPPVEVPLATDLGRAGKQAEKACVPLLLEFAADYCEYCTLLEEEILKPLLRNRDYDTRVLMRKLAIDRSARLRDFAGDSVDAGELAQRYKVDVTPTLLFVDSRGNELTERMIGVTTIEFYGAYLDEALDNSTRRLRETGRCE
jgi:thioredoxin-related protein